MQYLYALARAGRPEAEALLDGFRRQATRGAGFTAGAVWAQVALPVAEGIVAFLARRPEDAVRFLDRAMPRLHRIGGSHAQRDLFDQIRLAALTASGKWVDVQQTLEQRRVYDPDGVPLNRALAQAYEALGLPDQAAAAKARCQRLMR